MGDNQRASGERWLRLGEAADYLGVHPTTLRRWADEGEVLCIRTPGGRRRFTRRALDQFLASMSGGAMEDPKHAIVELAHSPISNSHGRSILRDEPWYTRISSNERSAFRQQGQQLMAALMHYAARDDAGEAYLQEASRVAQDYAELFHSAGLSVHDTIHAFILVKQSITDSLHDAGSLEGPPDVHTWRLYRRTHDFLDHVLMAMVDVYRHATSPQT